MTTMFPDYISERLNDSMIKNYLDIIVIAMLNDEPIHGYKLIGELHKTFGVLLSPGTLYPLLYHLKKEGLIEVKLFKRRKLYCLTDKGQIRVQTINVSYQKSNEKIFNFIDMHLSKTLDEDNR
jgi:DNA-binding PadR family transcriptional regulator